MTNDFFKFPSTPHLISLGAQRTRDDKLMLPDEVKDFLSSRITVEEKLDGANLGISIGADSDPQAQNRGNFIHRDAGGQFKQLWRWIDTRRDALTNSLRANLILFGEWCYAEHSVSYHELPDWFIGFDVYDRVKRRFYSVERRNALLAELDIEAIAALAKGAFNLSDFKGYIETPSRYGANHLEGIYLREDQGDWLRLRAKLVRPDFAQSITKHWSSRDIKVNRVNYGTGDHLS